MVERCDTQQVLSDLSTPLSCDPLSLSRRRFLQSAAVVGGVALIPQWFGNKAFAASSNSKVLVHITFAGGNDALNTVVPYATGAYHDSRSRLGFEAADLHRINNARGLNPHLGYLKQLWDNDNLAIIDGVGIPTKNLSHFDSMAQWMSGSLNRSGWYSGWIGRYLDEQSNDVSGVHIGYTVPLLVRGKNNSAIGIPPNTHAVLKTADLSYNQQSQLLAVKSFANSSIGSDLGNAVAASQLQSIEVADTFQSSFQVPLPDGDITSQLELCARLINANLGVKVFSLMFGGFDTHSNQISEHAGLMQDFNKGIQRFYETLNNSFEDNTLIVTASEFGRRVEENDSLGTDHGDASTVLAIGKKVNGGFYGELPSLSKLDVYGNLDINVDYRDVYGTVLSKWLAADPNQIFGRATETLNFLDLDPVIPPSTDGGGSGGNNPDGGGSGGNNSDGGNPGPGSGAPASIASAFFGLPQTKFHDYQTQVARLYLATFLRLPDMNGLRYWTDQLNGGTRLVDVADEFAASSEFRSRYGRLSNKAFITLVYRNVLKRQPDSAGLAHWLSVLAKGGSRGEIIVGFSESPEFKTRSKKQVVQIFERGSIARLYRAYFNRKADVKGLHYWTGTGQGLLTTSDAFAQSAEFVRKYGSLTNSQFIDLIYRNVLKRRPDMVGRTHWINSLNIGVSRGKIMLEFSESQEFIKRTKTLK